MDYKKLNVYVSTCNGYDVLIKPFYQLFNKFWGTDQNVVILGYRQPPFPLPDNFKFVSLGEEQKNVSDWSTDLRKFFETVDDEFFIYTVEDSFLLHPIDHVIMNSLSQYMKLPNIGRIALNSFSANKTNEFSQLEDKDYFKIAQQLQTGRFKMSALWSIWSKEYMLKYLQPNRNPWDAEVIGSEESKNDGFEVIATLDNYAVHHALGRRKGNGGPHETINIPLDFRWNDFDHLTLDDEHIQDLIDNNIINKNLTVKL